MLAEMTRLAATGADVARAGMAAAVLLAVGGVGGCGRGTVHAEGLTSDRLLDLSGYEIAFEETFKTLDIGDRPGTGKRWYNHTPWHGDFGDAAFADPGPGGPFSLGPNGLNITATRGTDGRWRSGLISSRDRDGPEGRGFAQKYGYFEINAKMPSGEGVWPAFWLIGVDKSGSSAEIDVLEYYGVGPKYYHSVAHIWRGGKDVLSKDFMIEVEDGSLEKRFNTFGVLIEPLTTTFYHNRREVGAMKTPPEFRQPFYILANLALGGGWSTAKLTSPKTLEIAYIRAYRATGSRASDPAE